MADQTSEKDYCEKLVRIVKREVKQIMEEAVTRKFVHEESCVITTLCASVDACLTHGLKRRALGLFKTNSTTALLQKVAKSFEPAGVVMKIVSDIENADPNKRSSSSDSFKIRNTNNSQKQQSGIKGNYNMRYLWIRIALFEKLLVDIVDHLVQNSSKYYEKDALVADQVFGQILSSLLVGPCALDYSKMKTQDHFWTDPPADELVQRHRLSGTVSNGPSTPPSGKKPLGYQKRAMDISKASTNSTDDNQCNGSPPVGKNPNLIWSPRDYVQSLHQNSRSTLLYGKNNVVIQPSENKEPMAGYLSLHSTPSGLVIKWTPNQLMNGCYASENESANDIANVQDKSAFWEYAMTVSVDQIVYLHCHQQEGNGTIVLVGQDGVQMSPIRFPKGGHLLSFLSCLENGLMPYGQLDPPLWSQKGKGKVFPRLKRKARGSTKSRTAEQSLGEIEDEDDLEPTDYVFRIIATFEKPDTISQELIDPNSTKTGSNPWKPHNGMRAHIYSTSSSTSSTISIKSLSDEVVSKITSAHGNTMNEEKMHIQILCDTMKRQIISRAFYGWLAHCRHLRTVRTHLSGLVNSKIIRSDDSNGSTGLTDKLWHSMQTPEGKITDPDQVYRLIYFGGIQGSIRKTVWPYLLGHYEFSMTNEEKVNRDEDVRQQYEMTMSEWLAVEAIVRQRDKEIMQANLAKLSSESTKSTTEIPLDGPKDHNMSNEVFETSSSESESDNDNDETKSNTANGINSTKKTRSKKNKKESSSSSSSRPTSAARRQLRRHRQVESQGSSPIFVTNPSVDVNVGEKIANQKDISDINKDTKEVLEPSLKTIADGEGEGHLAADTGSQCVSPASSNGGIYSNELLDSFSLNLHRIDKDVQRCDRNFWYFTNQNLEKLRNVMCTYVWEHLDIGYVQGMCDLVAPLLVIYDDEMLSYSCFCELMKRMVSNFPHGGAMDTHFANMRSLIQILDAEIFELMHQNGDYTHFYFCYRWFLLDFKRELVYDDVFLVWETIWAAKYISSSNLVLFIALALVEYYRDIILENNMDFTDIIKFFNEMAERHDAKAILRIARELVLQIQTLIENK